MLPLIWLLACREAPQVPPPPVPIPTPIPQTRPAPIPPDAVELRTDARDVRVGDVVVGPVAELLADPVEGLHPPLVDALAKHPKVWVHVGEDTPWMMVRKLVNSATEARSQVWLGTDTRGWDPPRPTRSKMSLSCEPGTAPVVGVDRSLTLELHRGADGIWAEGTVRFRPIVERASGRVAEDVPGPCWTGASCDLVEGVAKEACVAARGATEPPPSRVEIAGEVGCLLPIAKQPGDVAAWTQPLSQLLATFGVRPEDDVTLIPEATIPFATIAAVLDAFAAAKQPPPTFALPLVEGNDGAPLCDIPIRDRDALDRAMGHWLGSHL